MGMFNRIYIKCPDCGEELEFQTKSGSCMLENFDVENAPHSDLLGIDGDYEECPKCGKIVWFKLKSNYSIS